MSGLTTTVLSHGLIGGASDPTTVIDLAGGEWVTPLPAQVAALVEYGAGDYALTGTLAAAPVVVADDEFPHSCTITPRTETIAASGQPTYASGTPRTVRCHFQSRGSRDLAGRAARVVESDKLFLPDGTTITENDTVTAIVFYGTSTPVAAGTHEVVSATPWPGSHVECELREVR